MSNRSSLITYIVCASLLVSVSGRGVLHGQDREQPAVIRDKSETLELVNPRQDGWDSEAFAEEVSAAQKALIKLMASPSGKTESSAVESFTSQSFLPAELRKVGDDGTTLVQRGDPRGGSYRGRSGFEKAFGEWVSPWVGATGVRAKFKTIRASPDASGGTSVALFEGVGFHADHTVQQNATWSVRWKREDKKLRVQHVEVTDYERVTVRSGSNRLLSDCTASVLGHNPSYRDQLLVGSHDWLTRMDRNVARQTFGHQGVALGDVNGDGLDDVYICQGSGLPNKLFVQNADGTATDRSRDARVDWLEDTRSVLMIDLDNDGDQDLALASGEEVMVLSNDGQGRFTRRSLLPLGRPGFSLAAADYDVDGDLDIYACVYFSPKSDPNELAQPVPLFNATNGGRNVLWRNDDTRGEKWQFTDATDDVGLDHNNRRWSFAAVWEDVDNDGDLDLYVANDFGVNHLYRNDNIKFRDVAEATNALGRSFGMSAAFGDVNRDGLMDLYVSNMFSAAGSRITHQPGFREDDSDESRKQFQHLARGNSLFENTGSGNFKDISVASGTTMGRWAWASHFVDLNNDAWLDIIVANGWRTNELNDDL
jgi:hypothetical protein